MPVSNLLKDFHERFEVIIDPGVQSKANYIIWLVWMKACFSNKGNIEV